MKSHGDALPLLKARDELQESGLAVVGRSLTKEDGSDVPMLAEHFGNLTEPQRRGDATEAIVRMAFVVRGVTLLEPVGDNEPYDLVVDGGRGFSRIQVKTAYEGPNDGSVRFETRTTRVKSSGYERGRYDGRIEFFAVFSPETEDIYLIPIEDAPKDTMTIRYRTAKNNNREHVNWHADYLLDESLHLL